MKFNWWTFIFEALNFVVLAYVLYRLLYRPLRQAIDERKAATNKAQADAEKARPNAEALQKTLEAQRAELERTSDQILREALEHAESERKKLLAETEKALEQRRRDNQQALEHERAETLRSMREEVVRQAIQLTRRLLQEASDQTLHAQLVKRFVQTLQAIPENDRGEIRSQLKADEEPLLESAQELDGGPLGQIQRTVAEIAGKPVSLTVQIKPELLDGIRLRLGGQVWDGSLAAQLAEARRVAAKDTTS